MVSKVFKIEHSEISNNISKESVWNLWSDVNNWPKWDVGLATCKLEGNFEKGQSFLLTPVGNDEAISVKLQEVSHLKSFSDTTELPFGKLETFHQMDDTPNGIKVTHTITAEVDQAKADFFEKVIWSGIKTGVPESVKNIVRLAAINK